MQRITGIKIEIRDPIRLLVEPDHASILLSTLFCRKQTEIQGKGMNYLRLYSRFEAKPQHNLSSPALLSFFPILPLQSYQDLLLDPKCLNFLPLLSLYK